jgi:transposase-like protein
MKNGNTEEEQNLTEKTLMEIVRGGVYRIIAQALEIEVEEFISKYAHLKDKKGCQRLVRNGYLPERELLTPIGGLQVSVPRVRDRQGELRYASSLIPPYLRRVKEVDEFIPYLYLKGISTGDFSDVLSKIVGQEVELSANTVVRLKEAWTEEYKNWKDTNLEDKEYVYFWVDGVYFNIRLEEDRSCILVIMGATEDGKKELVAVGDGYRESELSWQEILQDLKRRGLKKGPKLAIGDGSLGFWKALRKEYPGTKEQRCWVHKMANVLDKMPKKVQKQAKRKIHNIYLASTKKEAENAFKEFVELYKDKYPKATNCLLKDKEETMTFYNFPEEHWHHIRTINPIESTFATVRLRSYKTKGCGTREATLMMVFKLVQSAEKRWQRLHGYRLIPLVLKDVKFVDGVIGEAA